VKPEEDDGSYGSGPRLLVLDQNAAPPTAIVDLGAGPVSLPLADKAGRMTYACELGERFVTRRAADGTGIVVDLTVLAPGEEACWFEGRLALDGGAPVPIKGACGC